MAYVNIGILLDQYDISSVDDFWDRNYSDRYAFIKHPNEAYSKKVFTSTKVAKEA